MSRGNARQRIFFSDADRRRFRSQLQDNLATFDVVLYAYESGPMSNKSIRYDSLSNLAAAIAEVLASSGPLKPKEIAQRLRQKGWGYSKTNAINKALHPARRRQGTLAGRNPFGNWTNLDSDAGDHIGPSRNAI